MEFLNNSELVTPATSAAMIVNIRTENNGVLYCSIKRREDDTAFVSVKFSRSFVYYPVP